MFRMRQKSIKRQIEAMEDATKNQPKARSGKPRRVTSEQFLSRVKKIRESGGRWTAGTIQ